MLIIIYTLVWVQILLVLPLLYPPNEVRGILWICDRRVSASASVEIFSTLYRVQFSTDFLQIWYGGRVWLGHETYWFWSQNSYNCGHQGAKTKIIVHCLVNADRLEFTTDFLHSWCIVSIWQCDDTYWFWATYNYNCDHQGAESETRFLGHISWTTWPNAFIFDMLLHNDKMQPYN